MPLAPILNTALAFGSQALRSTGILRRYGRRRRRGGLTANEMGKIVFMSSVLGKRNPAVTLMVMKAMGGKL